MKHIFVIIFYIFCSTTSMAQELTIKEFKEATNDLSARTHPRLDLNGNDCALVKVQLAASSVTFSGNVMGDVAFLNNEYWVYMTAGSKRVKVVHPSYLPLEVNFASYDVAQLKSRTTYVLTITLGDLPQSVQQPKVQTGWIILDSEPQGASVFINNEFAGNTPLSGYKQPLGTYTYRLELANYHSFSGSLELNSDRLEKKISLRPAFGSIQISCNEQGVTVLLDDKHTGKTAPCTLTEVPSGQHKISLQKDMYAPQQLSVTVEDGKVAEVKANLYARFAQMTVKTLKDAQIYINNELKGNTTFTGNLMEGFYDVETRLAHHSSVTRQIQIIANQPQTIELNPIPIYGSLDITSTPHDADVTIDGKSYGKTPLTVEELLEGEHTIIIAKQDYSSYNSNIKISGKETASVSAILKKGVVPTANESKTISKEAAYNLGVQYSFGRNGKSKDYSEAIKWYRKAADQGYDRAQYNLGIMYYNGQGVPQDYSEAFKWLRKAAEQGHAKAQSWIGAMYSHGQGVPQDYSEALKWYRKAADQGNADAQRCLGISYSYGRGVPQDYSEALKWYRKAADQGDAGAQCCLGILYTQGQGVPQDYSEALKWFRKAADQGDAQAPFDLGLMYEHGRGVPQDYSEALKWYRKAADQGNAGAKKALQRIQ